MLTLHFPFRNEDEELLAETKFIDIYDRQEEIILFPKEFVALLNIEKTIEIYKNLWEFLDTNEAHEVGNMLPEPNPFEWLFNDPNVDVNSDIRLAVLNKLIVIAKKWENCMNYDDFSQLMRKPNEKQRRILMEVISYLLSPSRLLFQLFFTGPAMYGKTFVIELLLIEIYNRYTDNDQCNTKHNLCFNR